MFSPEFLQSVALYCVVVVGVVEAMKRVIKAKGMIAVVVSIAASFVACLPELPAKGVVIYVGLAVCVALSANGLFKAFHAPNTTG